MTKLKSAGLTGKDLNRAVSVTNHFIVRAQERFGLHDLNDKAKTKAYVENWASEKIKDADEVVKLPNSKGNLCVRYKQIAIICTGETKNILCITCFPIQYNKTTKEYDTLATTIEKRKLRLDDFTQEKVDEKFKEVYYESVQSYAPELAKLHKSVSELYDKIANSKQKRSIDYSQATINQELSIIEAIQDKLFNLHNVAFKKEETNND